MCSANGWITAARTQIQELIQQVNVISQVGSTDVGELNDIEKVHQMSPRRRSCVQTPETNISLH